MKVLFYTLTSFFLVIYIVLLIGNAYFNVSRDFNVKTNDKNVNLCNGTTEFSLTQEDVSITLTNNTNGKGLPYINHLRLTREDENRFYKLLFVWLPSSFVVQRKVPKKRSVHTLSKYQSIENYRTLTNLPLMSYL